MKLNTRTMILTKLLKRLA